MIIDGRKFTLIGNVQPKRNPDGSIWTHEPQARYKRATTSKLHAYGHGAFCKFRFADAPEEPGVYLITRQGEVQYVGETVQLNRRLNDGYGNISPRNCFKGGQQTNCRMNKVILSLLRQDELVEVWFSRCEDHEELERKLKPSLAPPWNREGKVQLLPVGVSAEPRRHNAIGSRGRAILQAKFSDQLR